MKTEIRFIEFSNGAVSAPFFIWGFGYGSE